jgi:hypothetical protein
MVMMAVLLLVPMLELVVRGICGWWLTVVLAMAHAHVAAWSHSPLPVPVVRVLVLLPYWCPRLKVKHCVAVPLRVRNLLSNRRLERLDVGGKVSGLRHTSVRASTVVVYVWPQACSCPEDGTTDTRVWVRGLNK